MPKYRFKDDKIKFSEIMATFELFEDVYVEAKNPENTQNTLCHEVIEELHDIIIECNEDIEMADVEMYDEEKNGAITFSIRSKYRCLRTIAYAKVRLYNEFHSYRYVLYSECRLHKIALAYLKYLEYFFTYSYMVRDEVKQEINSEYDYFKQSPTIPCDGEDTGV